MHRHRSKPCRRRLRPPASPPPPPTSSPPRGRSIFRVAAGRHAAPRSYGFVTVGGRAGDSSYQPKVAIDMEQRYVAHCNVGTDIKQASFLREQGEFVASGSDDGRWFIWEKRTGRLIKMLAGDGAVVNCIQSHPYDCAVATSGIDNTVKLWTPDAKATSMVTGPEIDILNTIENNQQKLSRDREILLPFDFLERFRMHEFAEGSLHPLECAQT